MPNPLTQSHTTNWTSWQRLDAHNSQRPVDWRWRRARQIVAAGKPHGGRFDDPLVNQACKMLQMQANEMGLATLGEQVARRAQPDSLADAELTEEERIYAEMPDLYDAALLYTENLNARWQVEALLMTGAPIRYIADRTAFRPQVIGLYSQVFFDVHDRLKATSWVQNEILDSASRHDMPVGDPDKWWKTLGYQGYRSGLGSGLIEAFWDIDVLPEPVRNWYYGCVESNLLKQSAAYTATLRVNPEVANFFVQNFWTARKLQLEAKKTEQQAGGKDNELKARENLLESMNMTVGGIVNAGSRKVEPRLHESFSEELENLGIKVAGQIENKSAD